jgi:hypothetical protein
VGSVDSSSVTLVHKVFNCDGLVPNQTHYR